jgi:hypothetical protein
VNGAAERDCRRCYYSQVPALNDRFYNEAVKPYTWFAATMLFFSYVIGLLFTLRTHAATIWTEPDAQEKKILEMSASSLSKSSLILRSLGKRPDSPSPVRTSATASCISAWSVKRYTKLDSVLINPLRTMLDPARNLTATPLIWCHPRTTMHIRTTPST